MSARTLASVGLTLALLTACTVLDTIAPQVDESLVEVAAQYAIPSDELQAGRTTYLTTCARCHTAEPITRYTPAEWSEILPQMIEETRLEETKAAALRNYIRVVLEARTPRPVDLEVNPAKSPFSPI